MHTLKILLIGCYLISLSLQSKTGLYQVCKNYGFNQDGKYFTMKLSFVPIQTARLLGPELIDPNLKTSLKFSVDKSWANEEGLQVIGNPKNKKHIFSCPNYNMANYWNQPYVMYDITFDSVSNDLSFKLKQFRTVAAATAFIAAQTSSRLIFDGYSPEPLDGAIGQAAEGVHSSVYSLNYHIANGRYQSVECS